MRSSRSVTHDREASGLPSPPAPEGEDAAAGVLDEVGRVTLRAARRIVVSVVGGTLGLVGLILLVTPGPAFVVLSLALAVLAVEFAWARRWLRRLKDAATDTARRVGLADDPAGPAPETPHRPPDRPASCDSSARE